MTDRAGAAVQGPRNTCETPAENKTHPAASPPAGTPRISSGQAIVLRKTEGHSARSGVKQPRNRPGTETRTHRSLWSEVRASSTPDNAAACPFRLCDRSP
ncbi:hypothetical protein D623_10012001 [Myotis brandtii]|uniref:Uncharacterized protein n=1 Tax=Myotis brandtii TaxID=109478 RepID=S7NC98_MYOBR|nr:hypothetical protein D623_10012001 [Myotis brandtii]